MAARASGAAQRRKLRRLRAALRHEQQSIAMALASALHHSADKTTRAQHNAPQGQKNAGTKYYELSDEDVVLARGSRPPCLGEPRVPQEQGTDGTPWSRSSTPSLGLPSLDAPVPLVVEKLVDVIAFVEEQKKQEDATMDRLEDLVLDREAWRRWAAGDQEEEKEEEEEEAPESSLLSIFLAQVQGARRSTPTASWRACLRRWSLAWVWWRRLPT